MNFQCERNKMYANMKIAGIQTYSVLNDKIQKLDSLRLKQLRQTVEMQSNMSLNMNKIYI